jgi:hypothetical protein
MPDSVGEDAEEGDLEMPKVYEPVTQKKSSLLKISTFVKK